MLRVDMTTHKSILAENAVQGGKINKYIYPFSDGGVCVTYRAVITPLCDTTPAQLPQTCIFSPLYETNLFVSLLSVLRSFYYSKKLFLMRKHPETEAQRRAQPIAPAPDLHKMAPPSPPRYL